MSEEFETFQDTKTIELKQGLTAYADSHISFYDKVYKVIYKCKLYYVNPSVGLMKLYILYRVLNYGKVYYLY